MATKARLLIYHGDQRWLDEQMGRSLPEGRKMLGTDKAAPSITVIDVSSSLLTHAARRIVEEMQDG